MAQGLHPRVIADGFDLAKDHVLEFLDSFTVSIVRQPLLLVALQ